MDSAGGDNAANAAVTYNSNKKLSMSNQAASSFMHRGRRLFPLTAE